MLRRFLQPEQSYAILALRVLAIVIVPRGARQGEGIQFHLLATAAAIVVMAKGSGAWSLDRLLVRQYSGAATSTLPGPRALRAA